jgi:hypothetical protein
MICGSQDFGKVYSSPLVSSLDFLTGHFKEKN